MRSVFVRSLTFAALGAAIVTAGCDRPPGAQVDDTTGAVGVALQLAPGVSLDSVSYVINGPAGFSRSGTIGTANSTVLTAVISPLPAGAGFSIALDSTVAVGGTHCAGSSMFDVTPHTTTAVTVHLTCREVPLTGTVSIVGSLNVCPVVDGLAAMPAEVLVGSSLMLMASAHDADAAPSALTYQWSATGGMLSSVTAQSPTFTCTGAATVHVSVTVSDGDCTDTMGTTVACTGVPLVRINEIESNGGMPDDWIELVNAGTGAADITGWKLKDADDAHAFYIFPTGTIIPAGGFLVVDVAQFGFGLGTNDSVRLWNQLGSPIDSYSWGPHAATTYGRCPDGTGGFVTTVASTKGTANACAGGADGGAGTDGGTDAAAGTTGAAGTGGGSDAAAGTPGAQVVINEVESNGGTPDDWVELYNTGATTADISGWKFKDGDDSHAFYIIPAGTTVAPGAYFLLEVAQFSFGLGAADSVRLWTATDVPVDSYTWSVHAATTYGRCPNGMGTFSLMATSTKGTANDCGGTGAAGSGGTTGAAGSMGAAGTAAGAGGSASSSLPWPGTDTVVTVDEAGTFGTNLSGLHYQPGTGGAPDVLWAVQNSPSKLYRLLWNGTTWTSDATWPGGKVLHYATGLGQPDCEGVTKAEWTDPAIYVATERDNGVSAASRLSILRFDTGAAGTDLTATNDWNVTADLPAVGSNLGLEAIAYIPDTVLVAGGFFDEATHAAYAPATYPNHGTGLFFVGVEGTGAVHGYALDHVTNAFTRVATVSSGQAGIMDLAYDRDFGVLWGYHDNTVGNKATVFRIDTTPLSPTLGRFQIAKVYDRPPSLPNSNFEGITFAPTSQCVGGQRPFFWADDDQADGHAIRRGSIQCGALF